MFFMTRAVIIVQGAMSDLGVRDCTVGYLESIQPQSEGFQLQGKDLLVEEAVPR